MVVYEIPNSTLINQQFKEVSKFTIKVIEELNVTNNDNHDKYIIKENNNIYKVKF